ncbi:AbiH family protein [Chryseobacterium lineare]
MNRLVIIGNGFDLAHGLPTSYGSFLNWIWKNIGQIKTNEIFKSLFYVDHSYIKLESFSNYQEFCSTIKSQCRNSYYFFENSFYGEKTFKIFYQHPLVDENANLIFEFKNKLFELITIRSAENWVDIEHVYYQALISIVKEDNKFPQLGSINQLNAEFLEIKKLLENYLFEEVDNCYRFDNKFSHCKSILDLFEFKYASIDELFLEFPANYQKELKMFVNSFTGINIMNNISLFENLFLDFNYTQNINFYTNLLNKKKSTLLGRASHIQIHGKIFDSGNPINFGFGDEMDDHYKILENTGENKYLENIKSFMYFNNSNYRKLLNWIESKDYQIFIMGHSCGLSDRTLLNTLFEHNNCKSIKIFYHQKPDGTDNFTELSQNISRHFNKKSMMREKVVDKSLSIPLPQTVRYDLK